MDHSFLIDEKNILCTVADNIMAVPRSIRFPFTKYICAFVSFDMLLLPAASNFGSFPRIGLGLLVPLCFGSHTELEVHEDLQSLTDRA